MIIAAFTATGKTTFTEANGFDKLILDLDSRDFPHVKGWATEYVTQAKSWSDEGYIVLISTHGAVRRALAKAGIDYMLVYPARDLKGEYCERIDERGQYDLAQHIHDNWDRYLNSLENELTLVTKRVLHSGEFLSDALLAS